MEFPTHRNNSSFTLIELLVVLALVAILSVVVILTLNPAELIKQARDSNRLSDLATINTALNLFSADVTNGFMGTSTVVYVSIPSTTSTCSNLGLPTLPSGYTYNCVTATSTRNTDGTGWIPVNFQRISSNSPISQLPIDPINTTSTRLYYTYTTGGSWELNSSIEASKNKLGGNNDLVSKDGGSATSLYEIGNNLNLNPIEAGDASLVGYWNFEEGPSATSSDRSGYGNHGTWYGTGTHYSTGKVGSWAGQFASTTYDYIDILNNSAINFGTGDFTISAWVYSSAYRTSAGIISKGLYWVDRPGYTLTNISSPLTIWFVTYDGTNQSAVNTNMSTYGWTLLMGIKRGSVTETWVNGVRFSSGSAPTNSLDNTSSLIFGSGPSVKWTGSMDEVRMYNRALSTAEISSLYNATK